MLKNILFVLLMFVFVKATAQQGYSVSGIVTDEKDKPLPGATVFLGDSRKATASDSEGKFVLSEVRPGNYNLVVKMIGYVVTTQAFLLQNKNMRFRVKLQEDNLMLRTVNISGLKKADRQEYLDIFIKSFLGRSYNAAQCKILNTDDINIWLDKKNDVLYANSEEFLIIENKALGYRMKYLLNEFSCEQPYSYGGTIRYTGNLFFEDLAGNFRQQKRWEQERINSYLGSVQHFFRSMFSNTLEENGFVTYVIPNPSALNNMVKKNLNLIYKHLQPVSSFTRYISEIDSSYKTFNLGLMMKDSTELYVLYKLNSEPKDFLARGRVIQRNFKMPSGQLSILRPKLDSIVISKYGDINPVNGVMLVGFMGWGQMAGVLPSDYTLPPGTVLPVSKK